jgi:hypothetical protein
MHRFVASLAAAGLALAPMAPKAIAAGKGGYRAPYFAATTPGAWSRYAMTSDGKTESAYTYRRLSDENGRARVELKVEFTAGQFEGTWSTNQYLLSPDFRLEDDALSFSKHCVRLLMQSDKMDKMMEMDAATLPNIVDAAIDYASSVKFAGTEKVEGRDCDHYTYHYVSTEKNPTTYDGELWMNASVPFGLVRESASLKSQAGPESKYTMTLAATGSDSGAGPAPAASAAPVKPGDGKLTLAEAYIQGLVELDVRVDPDSKQGSRLFIAAVNKSQAPLHLAVTAGAMSFAAGMPLETLKVRVQKAATLDIRPGEKSPEWAAEQEGSRRALEGKFTLVVYDGEPLFAGSVTAGTADQP